MAAIEKKVQALEEAKWWVAQRMRDLNACMDYRQMPTYRKWLAEAQEELAYQTSTIS